MHHTETRHGCVFRNMVLGCLAMTCVTLMCYLSGSRPVSDLIVIED